MVAEVMEWRIPGEGGGLDKGGVHVRRCSRILGEKQGGLGLDAGSENMVGGGALKGILT